MQAKTTVERLISFRRSACEPLQLKELCAFLSVMKQ